MKCKKGPDRSGPFVAVSWVLLLVFLIRAFVLALRGILIPQPAAVVDAGEARSWVIHVGHRRLLGRCIGKTGPIIGPDQITYEHIWIR